MRKMKGRKEFLPKQKPCCDNLKQKKDKHKTAADGSNA